MSNLKCCKIGMSFILLASSNLTLAASPNDMLKFKNPADWQLYEQGEKLREKQETCVEKPGPGCALSAHDVQVLNKSVPLIEAMERGHSALSGIIGFEAMEKQWHPEEDIKTLQSDQTALKDYKSKHPVVTAISHVSSLVMNLTKIPDLQRNIDQASNQATLSQSSLKELRSGIQDFQADIASSGLIIVPGKTNSGGAQ